MVLLLLPPFYTLLDPIPSQTPFSLLLLCSRIPLYTGKALAGPLAPPSFKPALSQAQVKPGQMHDPPAAPGRGWRDRSGSDAQPVPSRPVLLQGGIWPLTAESSTASGMSIWLALQQIWVQTIQCNQNFSGFVIDTA